RVTCVDKSAQMLAKVQARLQPTSLVDVNLVQADATQTSFDASHYDVIVSLFFLDNFRASTLQALIPNLAESLNNQGIWILADFREITQGSGTWRSRAWLWLMYRFFRLVTDIEADKLTDPTEFLEQTGLNLLEQYSFQNGFIVLETWQQETH
ncbi:MAG: class I SAM-dependent methyltransferase, partial [Deinococcota bacterium]